MIIKEAQSQWLRRAHDLAFERTRNPEFSVAFASKLFEQTRMNPTFKGPTGVGIASLDPELEQADPLNPEEAINFAVERDAQILDAGGDVSQAIFNSITEGGGTNQQMRNIEENNQVIQDELFGKEEGETFDDFESPERRFRRAVATDDVAATKGVINEMINTRIGHGRANG